jgi:hypothetical protein
MRNIFYKEMRVILECPLPNPQLRYILKAVLLNFAQEGEFKDFTIPKQSPLLDNGL